MEIKLQYYNETITFIIDPEDSYLLLCKFYRPAKRGDIFYLYNVTDNKYFHRLVLNAPKDKWVDHINGNTLDNRKTNLRLVSPKENSWNRRKRKNKYTSNYHGVSYENYSKKWKASACYDGKYKSLGRFKTENEAAQAYNNFISKARGPLAKLNKIK